MRTIIGVAAACTLLLFAGLGLTLKFDSRPAAPEVQSAPVGAINSGTPLLELSAGSGEQEAENAFFKAEPHLAGGKRDFGMINGVSLSDGKADVMRKLGLPAAAPADEQLSSRTSWIYPGITIGFDGDQLNYILIPKEAGEVKVGGLTLPVDIEAWKNAFGKPDFEAEDGFGYVDANGMAAKLFVDGSSGKLTSIDFFWPMTSE
ncbi:hypothetical protein [Paenibacillus beijingensis]|uniref:Uncharacterized protein n=1 Tax=Paenibacillus beijingensis TaxID=1126833 RepID=A0A0D5NER8_9BACL|nr:hypothetical protein [Paenibacillus beijingensis]AJY73884.1 hypothetical protein VN24_03740 [Paenibacillus beijingensis]